MLRVEVLDIRASNCCPGGNFLSYPAMLPTQHALSDCARLKNAGHTSGGGPPLWCKGSIRGGFHVAVEARTLVLREVRLPVLEPGVPWGPLPARLGALPDDSESLCAASSTVKECVFSSLANWSDGAVCLLPLDRQGGISLRVLARHLHAVTGHGEEKGWWDWSWVMPHLGLYGRCLVTKLSSAQTEKSWISESQALGFFCGDLAVKERLAWRCISGNMRFSLNVTRQARVQQTGQNAKRRQHLLFLFAVSVTLCQRLWNTK